MVGRCSVIFVSPTQTKEEAKMEARRIEVVKNTTTGKWELKNFNTGTVLVTAKTRKAAIARAEWDTVAKTWIVK